jgi:hypothetical protein
MLYLLFSLVVILIILFIIANIQITSYSKKYENFTISTIGNIRDKYKEISAIKFRTKNKKEIEDVQFVDNSEVLQYLD